LGIAFDAMALDYSQLQALNALMSEGGPDEWTPPDQQHGASAASSKRMTPASIGPAASTASASAMLAASKQQVRGESDCELHEHVSGCVVQRRQMGACTIH
jgi:hypothetical protein